MAANYGKKNFVGTISLMSALILAAAALAYFIFNEADIKRKNIKETRNQIFQYEKRIENAKSLERDISEVENYGDQISRILSGGAGSVVNFIEELEFLAEKTGVELKINYIKTPQKNDGGIDLRIELEGDFSRVYRYVYLLENESFFASEEALILQKTTEKNKWAAHVDLKIFNFDENEN